MIRKLILPVMILGLLFGAASMAFGQNVPIPNDTMKVVDSFGRPGDTITVNIYVENSQVVLEGLSANLYFNPSIIRFIDGSVAPVGRNGDTLDTPTGYLFNDSLLVVNLVSWHSNLPGHLLHYGRGVVGRMRFRIQPTAMYGDRTYIHFGDNGFQTFNGWADSTGDGTLYLPSMITGMITVTGGSFNQPPVIDQIGAQEVRAGQTLTFGVSSYDLDGDPITLSGQNLPANSSFPTVQGDSIVTGIFTFTPSFEQGADTFYVSFRAADDHNNTASITVPIIVLAQPNDYLSVDSHQGGVPGASGRNINIDLNNSHNLYGLQFDCYYDIRQITVSDVVFTERVWGQGLGWWYSEPEPGHVIVLIFSPGLDPILPGNGTVAMVVTSVNVDALFGPTPIVLDSAIAVIDSIGTSRNIVMNSGFFTVDHFGDANLDGLVNVGDCVTIAAFIVGRYVLDVRQFDAGDINRDTRVSLGDLQNVIDLILRIPTGPGPIAPGPLVSAELRRPDAISGSTISVPIWVDVSTEAAAVQYEVNYNPDRLEPLDVVPGDMVRDLLMDHTEANGKARGVFYNLRGTTFGPSSGELVTLNFRLKTGRFSPRDLGLSEFSIVNLGAGLIPSEIKGQLPTDYILEQNYPNPFNSSTTISFDLPDDGQVELSIYDVLGRKVSTLMNEFLTAGNHSVTWDGRSDSGENVASGVFFYRLQSGDYDQTKRMLLMK